MVHTKEVWPEERDDHNPCPYTWMRRRSSRVAQPVPAGMPIQSQGFFFAVWKHRPRRNPRMQFPAHFKHWTRFAGCNPKHCTTVLEVLRANGSTLGPAQR